jgi:hypothetical protein
VRPYSDRLTSAYNSYRAAGAFFAGTAAATAIAIWAQSVTFIWIALAGMAVSAAWRTAARSAITRNWPLAGLSTFVPGRTSLIRKRDHDRMAAIIRSIERSK